MKEIAIIGAGSWGTALALVAARAGNRARLWAHDGELAAMLKRERENKIYLPGFTLPESIKPTSDLAEALAGAEFVLTVVPSHVCRAVYAQMKPHLRPEMIFVSATKGIEIATQMRVEE